MFSVAKSVDKMSSKINKILVWYKCFVSNNTISISFMNVINVKK